MPGMSFPRPDSLHAVDCTEYLRYYSKHTEFRLMIVSPTGGTQILTFRNILPTPALQSRGHGAILFSVESSVDVVIRFF